MAAFAQVDFEVGVAATVVFAGGYDGFGLLFSIKS